MSSEFKSIYGIVLAFVLSALPALSFSIPLQQAPGAGSKPDPVPTEKKTDFESARAFEHVKRLVEIGPRPSGSDTIKKAQAYIKGELKSYGLKVIDDDLIASTPRGKVPMKNIIGELTGAKPEIVIISSHYDTKRQPRFVGANDGGSSTAAVLEIARALSKTRPVYTLWFIFFDGEEAVVDWYANNGKDNTYGSRHLARKLTMDGTIKRVKAMILLDMIGDAALDLNRESESTPWLVDLIWDTAHRIGYGEYFLADETEISDDHLPFKEAGVPVIDLIDFNFGPDNAYWHTDHDTIDKVSSESLKVIGDVVISALPNLFKRLDSTGSKETNSRQPHSPRPKGEKH